MAKGRPGGNPDIVEYSKLSHGAKTPEGKLKVMMSSQHLRKKLLVSKGSKVLAMVRQCDYCPLRTKVNRKEFNGKITEITHYSTCPGYKKGKIECIMPIRNYVKKVGVFYDLTSKANGIELQKAFIIRSVMDAEESREMETLAKGHPGFYTDKHTERAMKYTADMNKLIMGEKVKHEVDIDTKVEVKMTDFSDDQLRRIADIMLEQKKEKAIDVEGKVNER